MRTPTLFALAIGAAVGAAPGCSSSDQSGTTAASTGDDSAAPPAPIVVILADTNRNGSIDPADPTETTNKTTWDAKHGAVMLANIDDDMRACRPTNTAGTALLSDVDLAKCNDAADTVVNGDADALDLAPVAVVAWPDAPGGTTATITPSDAAAKMVHLFRKNAAGAWDWFDFTQASLSDADVRAGATFGIEATDIVRDASKWDGTVTLTLSVADAAGNALGTDAVVLRVSPVVTRHHLDGERRIYVTKFATDPGSVAMRQALAAGIAATHPEMSALVDDTSVDGDQSYGSDQPYSDQWTQDFFETAYMAMPAPGGKAHVIDVFYRSPNVFQPGDKANPLREAGKIVFTKFRGPDAAAVQQYDIAHPQEMDSLDSFGNLETIPPYSLTGKSFPLGRVVRGSVATMHPDATFEKMIESQAVQPPVYLDTSWLNVGHVDETMSFVKAPTPRGWALVANDPALAKKMLQAQSAAGNGAVQMFVGEKWLDNNNQEQPAVISIDAALADTDVMTESAAAATHLDSQIAILKKETGLTDDEIVRIPYLYSTVQGAALAWQVGTINGLSFAPDTFAAPDPHGPVIGGKDIFKDQMEQALSKLGIKVAWVEDWDLYHRLSGEVHCGTNSLRALPEVKWWESGY